MLLVKTLAAVGTVAVVALTSPPAAGDPGATPPLGSVREQLCELRFDVGGVPGAQIGRGLARQRHRQSRVACEGSPAAAERGRDRLA